MPPDNPSSPPTPKPKHPLRRLALSFLFLILAVILAHATWGHLAQRRLDARLRHLHAAGQPIYPADFATPVPPARQNAADDLLAATDILRTPGAIPKSFDRIHLGLPLTPDEIQTITDTLAARRDVLALADAAARKPQVHWDLDPNTPTLLALFPGINGARGLAILLRADALLAHQQGRDDHALDRIEQILRLAHHVDQQPALVPHLVAVGMAALAAQSAEDIAPDLRIGTAPGHVPPARVRALVDQLLDDQPLRAGMLRALRGERKDAVLAVDPILAGTFNPALPANVAPPPTSPSAAAAGHSAAAYALKPLFVDDADTLVRAYTKMIQGFQASPDLPAYAAAVDLQRQFPEVSARPALHLYASKMMPSGNRIMPIHYRITTDLRLAATALAIRAYATDHANQLPPTLDALVPTYLPAVPVDALAPAGARLHYRPAAPDPILYSVGDDATDNAGDDHAAAPRHSDVRPLDRWQAKDAVLHLTRQPRYIPPPDEDPQP